jgi:hypothetical protein
MLENKYNKLADKGWNNMESILDREMPVKSDRRWLVFFLLSAFLIGASGWYLLSRSPESDGDQLANTGELKTRLEEDEKRTDLVSKSIASQEVENLFESISLPTKDVIGQDVGSKLAKNKGQNVRSSTTSQKSKLEVGILNGNETDFEASAVLVERETQFITGTKESPIGMRNNESEGALDLSKVSDIKKADFKEKRSEDDQLRMEVGHRFNNKVAAIGTRDIKNVEFGVQFESIDEQLNIYKVRQPLYASLYGGYSLPLASQISGPYAGFEVGKNFTRRWIWSANIGFNVATNNIRRSFSQQDASEVFSPTEIQSDPNLDAPDSEVLVVGVTNGGVSLNEQYYDLVAERLGRLFYMDLGLGARYSVSQRNQVGVGLNYSYLVSSVTDYISLSEFANSLAWRNGGLRRDVLIQENLINRHNLSLMGTYQYQVTKRLNLHLRFNLGLNQIIKVQEVSDYRNRLNYLGIGLGYKLKV